MEDKYFERFKKLRSKSNYKRGLKSEASDILKKNFIEKLDEDYSKIIK
jgi:hypothetical protein|tara:strand:- start:5875 stop:6018 length:144 start_codon:yes stop_codon:yes gene_type:complete